MRLRSPKCLWIVSSFDSILSRVRNRTPRPQALLTLQKRQSYGQPRAVRISTRPIAGIIQERVIEYRDLFTGQGHQWRDAGDNPSAIPNQDADGKPGFIPAPCQEIQQRHDARFPFSAHSQDKAKIRTLPMDPPTGLHHEREDGIPYGQRRDAGWERKKQRRQGIDPEILWSDPGGGIDNPNLYPGFRQHSGNDQWPLGRRELTPVPWRQTTIHQGHTFEGPNSCDTNQSSSTKAAGIGSRQVRLESIPWPSAHPCRY